MTIDEFRALANKRNHGSITVRVASKRKPRTISWGGNGNPHDLWVWCGNKLIERIYLGGDASRSKGASNQIQKPRSAGNRLRAGRSPANMAPADSDAALRLAKYIPA